MPCPYLRGVASHLAAGEREAGVGVDACAATGCAAIARQPHSHQIHQGMVGGGDAACQAGAATPAGKLKVGELHNRRGAGDMHQRQWLRRAAGVGSAGEQRAAAALRAGTVALQPDRGGDHQGAAQLNVSCQLHHAAVAPAQVGSRQRRPQLLLAASGDGMLRA